MEAETEGEVDGGGGGQDIVYQGRGLVIRTAVVVGDGTIRQVIGDSTGWFTLWTWHAWHGRRLFVLRGGF